MMQITVSDPVKHSEGPMNAHVTYKVTTRTDLERFDSNLLCVHRRYSDFVWLQQQLADAFPGLIIPPLPEKHVIGRFNEPFLSQRQRSLESFLRRIASHEQLRDNQFVKAFLEADNLEETKERVARMSKKTDKSFWQWATAATNSISSKMGTPANINKPKSEEDGKFDELKQYVNALDPQIKAVHNHSHALVERNKEMAQALFDFGQAFTLLGQAEGDNLGDAMQQLGQCADKLSRITAVEADKEAQFFDEPIKDYVRLVKQVKAALEVRVQKLHEYESFVAAVEAKKQSRDRLSTARGNDPQMHSVKLNAAEEELTQAQKSVEKTKEEFDVITRRVFEELDRFKKEKLIDFKSIVLDYVQLQIEYNQEVERSWKEVLPALQALSATVESNSTPNFPNPAIGSAPENSQRRNTDDTDDLPDFRKASSILSSGGAGELKGDAKIGSEAKDLHEVADDTLEIDADNNDDKNNVIMGGQGNKSDDENYGDEEDQAANFI